MAEADYITHSIAVADMQTDVEYHMDSPAAAYRPDVNASANYTGTQGWKLLGRCSGFGMGRLPAGISTLRAGYWFRSVGWYPDLMTFFHVQSADYTKEQLRIYLDPISYTLDVAEWQSGPNALVDVSSSVDIGAVLSNIYEWQHIGLYYDLDDALLTLYCNGKLAVQAAGLTVPSPTNLFAGQTSLVGNYVEMDDFYLDYSYAVEINEPPPARRFYPALPNGAGSSSDWTPAGAGSNYQCVDDPSTPDDDTTYVTAIANGKMDMYACASVNHPLDETATAALIQAYVTFNTRREGIFGALRFAFADTSSADYGTQKQVQFTWPTENEWAVLTDRMPDKPSGGSWSVAEFNGGEFGFESAELT